MKTTFTTTNLSTTTPFHVGGIRLFLLDWNKKKYLVKDYCPHRGGPLSLGDQMTDEDKIVCPWHKNKVCATRLTTMALPMVRVGNQVRFSLEEQTDAVH
jgi:nitrite reductase/ring-hydroxylating ferredoxin subunit